MIEYFYDHFRLMVRRNGKTCGEICKVKDGYQYFPEGNENGDEILPSIAAVQISLMDEE